MNNKTIKEKLLKAGVQGVSFSRKKGTFKALMGYFYRPQAGTFEELERKVETALFDDMKNSKKLEIVNKGDHFANFKGGAKLGTKDSSYIFIEYKIV